MKPREEVSFEEQLARFEEQKAIIDKGIGKSREELSSLCVELVAKKGEITRAIADFGAEKAKLMADYAEAQKELEKVKAYKDAVVSDIAKKVDEVAEVSALIADMTAKSEAEKIHAKELSDEAMTKFLESKKVLEEAQIIRASVDNKRANIEKELADREILAKLREEALTDSECLFVVKQKELATKEEKLNRDATELEKDISALIEERKRLAIHEKDVDEKIARATIKEKELEQREKQVDSDKALVAEKLAELDRRLESAKANEKAINERAKQLK